MMMMTLVKVFAANRVCFLASRTKRECGCGAENFCMLTSSLNIA